MKTYLYQGKEYYLTDNGQMTDHERIGVTEEFKWEATQNGDSHDRAETD